MNATQIISELGKFEAERNPLKKLARQGQCFSTTKAIEGLTILMEDFTEITDVKVEISRDYYDEGEVVEDKEYFNFTDGSGFISAEMSQTINKAYDLNDCNTYQVRVGGCKGVLHVSPFLEGKKVQYRKSMKKFDVSGDSVSIEIIRCGTFSQGHLNRQIIQLLCCLDKTTRARREKDLYMPAEEKTMETIIRNLQDENIKFLKPRALCKMIQKNASEMNKKLKEAQPEKEEELNLNSSQFKKYDVFFGAAKVFKQIFQKAALSQVQLLEEPIFGTIMYNMALG